MIPHKNRDVEQIQFTSLFHQDIFKPFKMRSYTGSGEFPAWFSSTFFNAEALLECAHSMGMQCLFASAAALVLFVIVAGLTMLQKKFEKNDF